jgi:p-hydroxybenzoate 3-monooxygenase
VHPLVVPVENPGEPSRTVKKESFVRTRVVIVGAGPAGLLLAHLLDRAGVESVLLETRSATYVLGRIRAGVLESSSVDLLTEVGLGERIAREGDEHRGIYLQWTQGRDTERHHLDFVDHVGRSVWVYGQTELTKDLMAAREAAGLQAYYEVADVALHDVETERPSVTFTDRDGRRQRIEADVVAGCDGFHGPSRAAVPTSVRRTWERVYPYAWLGVLADVPPSTDELIYAWHPDGFALHSMRSATVSRLYLQVAKDEDVARWSDDRVWDALATRLGHGRNGWSLRQGPITEKSVLPMRSHVATPMRHGRLFLAGDAAHIVPPTGAKGLNLAIADVTLLARALSALLVDGSSGLADSYSEDALRRVWRCTHFSWWMTTMLHTVPADRGDDFDAQLQLSQLRWVTSSPAGAAGLAENYAGLPIGF